MSSETSQPRGASLAMIFLAATACISSMGIGLIAPVMPALLVDITGGDLAGASFWGGIALISYAVMQFVFSPIFGALSDRFGRRPILLMSLFAYAADMLLLAIVQTLPWFLLIRGLAGIFASTFSTTSAYVADITPPNERASRFAIIGAAFGVGFILGPAIGGALGNYDVRYPFFAGAALALMNAAFGAVYVGESLAYENRRAFSWSRANTFGTLLRLFKTTGIQALLPVFFLATLSSWVYPTVWSYVAKERFLWSEGEIGLSIAYYGVIAFIAQAVVVQVLMPRMRVPTVIRLALVVEVFALTGIGLASTGWFVYLMITTALISTMQDSAIRQALSAQVAEDSQGELQGGLSAMSSVAMIMAPLIYNGAFTLTAGTGAVFYFPGSPFIIAAGMSVLAVLLYSRKRARQS